MHVNIHINDVNIDKPNLNYVYTAVQKFGFRKFFSVFKKYLMLSKAAFI